MNYFELFGLVAKVEIDQGALKRAFYEKSRSSHPDFHGQKSQEEQDDFLDMSTNLNQAYRVLKDRDRRIKYLIEEIGGGDVEASQNLDPMFLMEMMELNEKIMEISLEGGERMREEILERDELSYRALEGLVERDVLGFEEKDWEILKKYYFERRYLLRGINNLNNLAAD